MTKKHLLTNERPLLRNCLEVRQSSHLETLKKLRSKGRTIRIMSNSTLKSASCSARRHNAPPCALCNAHAHGGIFGFSQRINPFRNFYQNLRPSIQKVALSTNTP